ncbi:hypothetical protein RclHR1_03290003 [Rhizophagus clarus]|uniref:Uncharacterized protein n=1 Tax=Rhizophagus clarus TaxID=94130 RepID=A0A2Z6R8R9_9GLOM|nr:hypothetical protein RclHR1_03290003 [Rhizophagus clarus]GES84007.1 hypothetical protein RCL_jg19542.t1 [Rhizophagus clarus]
MNSSDLLDIAKCNRNSYAHMHTLLRRKPPKIFQSTQDKYPDEDTRMTESVQTPKNSGFLITKLHFNKRVSSFHNYVFNNKRIKLLPTDFLSQMDNHDRAPAIIPSTSSTRPVDSDKNLLSGRTNPSHDDVSILKRVKSTYNNGD